jgi:DNA-binding transcriptional LysR family regulator
VNEGLLTLLEEHPDLALELLAGNAAVDLARGEADLALRLTALKQSSLRAQCVARVGIGLFAAPTYLRRRGAVHDAEGLLGHDLLLPTGELSRLPEARWLASRPRARVVFRSNSMPALVAAAVAARGIVPLPLGWGDGEPDLERVLVLDAIPKRKLWLVTHEAAGDRPAVRLVSQHVRSILGRLMPG